MYARLKFRILLFCLGLSKVCSTFDQLANLHSDTLRDLAPFLCMERSNRIPMEIFRLATRNENQRTNGPVNAHRGSGSPPPRNLKSLPKKGNFGIFWGVGPPPPLPRLRQYFTILVGPPLVKMSGSANQGHPRVIILSNYDGLE